MAVVIGRPIPARGPMSDVTRILSQVEEGGPKAAEELLLLVYVVLAQHSVSHGYYFAAAVAAVERILIDQAREKENARR
jgi:hypothetical protein